ncbi:deoxynucleoside triphosphate triphosphohydrolase SAMHD1-like [Haliotis rufescens]|uniref:deoxynucleoside triphosphate triphosphohydrolase SAMHD1-like n=1 Tax=Haliotis rufescens TaxID=6454 RepID=UPI00201F6137|nr:deoxynucleoside triphosphate triphosphohydrolase SAMHD1-like [Haliotis rufescens]
MSTNQLEKVYKRKADLVEGGDTEDSSKKQSLLKNVVQSGTSSFPLSDSDSKESKIFNDPIHGTITVTGLCVKIVDTPQFQRLRYLKQLGGTFFVFPGASHSRFEHSIGTYYLGGKFARILKQKHPQQFEEGDIECIEIAGLCHDLGHGPFSHVFEKMFIPCVRKDKTWKHEDASVEMLEHLLKANDQVMKAFEEFDKDGTRLALIKDLILGGKETEHVEDERVQQKRKKRFLYEIVANAQTGIDVDKWDYLARDCHMLGIKNNFDHDRYMELARIIDVEGEGPRICARDKEENNLYDMFRTRETLHRRAYQHKVKIGVELMIVDVLVKVDKTVQISGSDRDQVSKGRNISECIDDMKAYSKLNDSILQLVELPITLGTSHQETDSGAMEDLKEARNIIRRVRARQLYKCVGTRILQDGDTFTQEDIQRYKREILEKPGRSFNENQFELALMYFDYGQKKEDPITNVRFYKKSNPGKAFLSTKQKSQMLPAVFQERAVAIYSKEKEFEKDIARSFKQRWPDSEIPEEYNGEPEASNQ